ncbi:hypothetical protein BCR35DRAFT_223624 [Leucosporidium creatinivorum]|uniref:RING-type domain-containing protein n=1 Tax=Leucosporidium creatinivorum TaxID=106004 RepID=A0A1Y2D760_9BASI|nr:hypothetical protein BCR35DRAFT_223624 [Leucosporidium creatinivorum]
MGIPTERFVEKVDDGFLCGICSEVLKGATLSGCKEQHTYCSECIKSWIPSRGTSCPACREKVTESSLFGLKALDRIIGGWRVKCEHAGAGCDWQGSFADLASHLTDDCLYQLHPCRFAHKGCLVQVSSKTLYRHLEYGCDYNESICPRGGRDCGGEGKGIYLARNSSEHFTVCGRHK